MSERVPIDKVLSALRQFPAGATTKQLAEKLGMKQTSVSSRLGKAWMYGGPIDREVIRPNPPGQTGRHFVWRAR